jgi:hypothetical protein
MPNLIIGPNKRFEWDTESSTVAYILNDKKSTVFSDAERLRHLIQISRARKKIAKGKENLYTECMKLIAKGFGSFNLAVKELMQMTTATKEDRAIVKNLLDEVFSKRTEVSTPYSVDSRQRCPRESQDRAESIGVFLPLRR